MKLKKIVFLFTVIFLICSLLTSPAFATGSRFNMSYLYFGRPSSYLSAVEQTHESLNEVSPNYFDLNPDGSLDLTSSVSADFVSEMHRRNIRVVPFLSNHWDRELGVAALNNTESLTSQIADAVETYSLDGVHIDLENLTNIHCQDYVKFVKRLREKIPKNKTVAVAVAANPYYLSVGWHGSYDYAKLAEVSDYLMIMAYDEHYAGSSPGPISSQSFVEKSITYALQFVAPEKIVLGIPFFGRIWSDSGNLMTGYGISDTQIEQLIQTYDGSVTNDDVSQSAMAKITIEANDKKPVIGGKTLSAGTYTIWYENEQSKKGLLKLVEKYNLKGTGSWSLQQEAPKTWDYYHLWLEGLYFTDVQGHWAMQSIISVCDSDLMKGVSSSSFAPNRSLSRAETAVILTRMLKLTPPPSGMSGFADTTNHWAKDAILSAKQHGVIQGIDSNHFAPDAYVTRQQLAALLYRSISPTESTNTNSTPFSDITHTENAWSFNSILYLTSAGILQGYSDGTFRPDEQVTRGQMAAILARMTAMKINQR